MNRSFGGSSRKINREKIDMTSMVDVTFLLLIFFMVTASFTIQASMDLPAHYRDEPGKPIDNTIESPDYVNIFVTPYNEYRIRTQQHDWSDASNRHELRVKLMEALNHSPAPQKLHIMAHRDCFHDTVVHALDLGIELQFRIRVTMTDEEF